MINQFDPNGKDEAVEAGNGAEQTSEETTQETASEETAGAGEGAE